MNITACIITDGKKNKALVECVKSIEKSCIEILIGANGGSFPEVKLLFSKNHKVRVIEQIWKKDFSKARNEIIKIASGDWILTIDSDERLEKDITFLDTKFDFYFIAQINNGFPYWNARIFKNHKGYFYKNKMHESIEHHITNENGAKANINILHSGYELSEDEMNEKLERNYELMLTDKGNPVRNYHLGNYEYLKNKDYDKALKYYYKAMKDRLNAEHKASILNCIFACQTMLKYDTRITMNTVADSIKVLPLQKQARVNAVEHLISVVNDKNKKLLIPMIEKQLTKIEKIQNNKNTMLYSDIDLNTNYFKNKKEEIIKWQLD